MKKRKPIVHAKTVSGKLTGEAIVEAVENQLSDNNPPETRQALERLKSMGETRENAIRYIACALSVEIFDAVQKSLPYNAERYVKNLNALPELPLDDDSEI